MEKFNQYDIFKEKCNDFPQKFNKRYFINARIICHPTIENELIAVCSEEEAKSNALHICRFADVMLMSANGEEWEAFNLIKARSVAEQNGAVFLTDLLFESAFISEEWMINGKNDTIIVSEAYMKEKGKRYAPVTPLTNKVLRFKKLNNEFFWKKSSPESVAVLDENAIKASLVDYFDACAAASPKLSECAELSFPLFDLEVKINPNATRIDAVNAFFKEMDAAAETFEKNAEVINIAEYDFSAEDFFIELAVAALVGDGIDINKDGFMTKYYLPLFDKGEKELADALKALDGMSEYPEFDCAKAAYIEALTKEGGFGFDYSSGGDATFADELRRIELGGMSVSEEKYELVKLLGKKPSNGAVFALINGSYPEEAEKAAAIREFWKIPELSGEELVKAVCSSYIGDGIIGGGKFSAGYEQAVIIRDNLLSVNKKYRFDNNAYIVSLNEYIQKTEIERRSFNGTVFETRDDMKKAMSTELMLRELCADLSALDRSGLNSLAVYIRKLTLDRKNVAKYLVKVKIALNDCEANVLNQLCIGLDFMSCDQADELKKKILGLNFDEAIAAPFIAKVEDRLMSAQRDELEKLVSGADGMTLNELDGLIEKLGSDKYLHVLSKRFKLKAESARSRLISAEIDALCDNIEYLSADKLIGLKTELEKYHEKYTYGAVKRVNSLLKFHEIKRAKDTFKNISEASGEELKELKKLLGDFSADIAEVHSKRIEMREKILLDEEIADLCKDIDSSEQKALDALKEKIRTGKYDGKLVETYLDKIVQRECELKNAGLAERCKGISGMDSKTLSEIKEDLQNGGYDEELTSVYLKKVAGREKTLKEEEIIRRYGDISEIDDINKLEKMNEDINSPEFEDISDRFSEKISLRIEEVKRENRQKKLESVKNMNFEEIDVFLKETEDGRAEMEDGFYEKCKEAVRKRFNAIEVEELDEICGDIDAIKDIKKINSVIDLIREKLYKPENASPHIKKLQARMDVIHAETLKEMTRGYENKSKEQLFELLPLISKYECDAEIKKPFINGVNGRIGILSEKEIKELCGDISALSFKDCSDIIVKIERSKLDDKIRKDYTDRLDAQALAIKEEESNEHIKFLTKIMDEYGVSPAQLYVPGLSNIFFNKYDAACQSYASVGRYEFPILYHETNADESFIMTTEYLYVKSKNGVCNRYKIDEISTLQAKKGLMSSSLQVALKDGAINELPCGFPKASVENAAKAISTLVVFINDKRAAKLIREAKKNSEKEYIPRAKLNSDFGPAKKPAESHEVEAKKEGLPVAVASSVPAAEPEPKKAPEAQKPELVKPAAEKSEATMTEPVKKAEAITTEPVKKAENPAEKAPEPQKESDKKESVSKDETKEKESAVKEETKDNSSGVKDEKEKSSDVKAATAEEKEEENKEVKPKFCSECGAKIERSTAKFCSECGSKIA